MRRLIGAAVVGLGIELVVLPLWLLPRSPAWGLLLIPLTLLTTPFWSLLHEAIHGSLVRDRRANDAWGRVLAIGYGAPFALLKSGHLLHHRYSRTERERTEIYATGRWASHAPGYYLRLFGGLYLAEVASVLLALLPERGWAALVRRTDRPDTITGLLFDRVRRRFLTQFRLDASAVVAVHLAAFLAYGRYGWMLVAALAGRGLLISLADNAYHYGTRLDASLEALNLRLPRPLETFVLAFNLHSVHHRHPGLPWHELRTAFAADGDEFHDDWFAAVGKQLRGPLPAGTLIASSPGVRRH
ncbi:fatty acid desaturase family protein [Cryptosporangium phraense]|uniref:Fatty acid desaturase n=1 Tax=Cryptosporangium phraense TaxID=2593070 RepID=A0A545AIB6_9ACTN|nr:fatty acid desaturase [Cryptosporangium phraense]TQS41062.1 fatty acid desaturase [Cryptosporangium phraense]